MKKIFKSLLIAVITVLTAVTVTLTASAADAGRWIAAWGTGPTDISLSGYDNIAPLLGSVTGRTVITSTAGGSKVRIRFSNYYGKTPLTINGATVAKSASVSTNPNEIGSEIRTDTLKTLTFGGNRTVTIPKGTEIYSDPVDLSVAPMENLAVSYFCRSLSEIRTMGLSGGTTFISIGDRSKASERSFGLAFEIDPEINKYVNSLLPSNIDIRLTYKMVRIVPLVASVDVYSTKDAYSVAVVGDSTVANEFPRMLAENIKTEGVFNVGVMGKGIMGNMLLRDGLGIAGSVYGKSLLSRFQKDVLSQSGVDYVIIKIGVNDIVHPVCKDNTEKYPGLKQPTANELIAGYKKLFDACHKAGKKVMVCSITQWKGNTRDYFGTGDKYVRTDAEFKRDWKIATDVNAWLVGSHDHDGFIDLTKVSQNPIDPEALYLEYTTDGVHPKENLQKIWADEFPLGLIGVTRNVGYVRTSAPSATLNIGAQKKLTAEVLPSNAINKAVTWKSSNTKVATVDKNGLVKAVANGKANITATSADGGYRGVTAVTVVTPVKSLSLSASSVSVYNTKSVTLKAVISPSTASNKTVQWSTSDKKIATVDKDGKVVGVKAGKAVITAKSNNGITAKCTVTVKQKTNVKSLKLNVTERSIYRKETYKLKPTIAPSNATFKDVKWKSSNTKVATVDKNGVVTAVAKGTATITCTSGDNSAAKATCKVTVKVRTTGVKLSASSISIYDTTSKKLTAKVSPSDATYKGVKWSSSNSKIASVDKNGKVTAKKPGKVTITCKTDNGGITAKCTVTVKKIIRTKKVELKNYTVNDGTKTQLKPKFTPSNATLKNCKWTVSDSKIASIDSKGNLTAKKPGKVTVTCKTLDTGKSAKCTVTVKAVKVKSIKFSAAAKSIVNGKSLTFKPEFNPKNTTDKSLTWKSSNSKVATVDKNGVVRAVGVGKAKITCTTKLGKKSASYTVTVTPAKVTSVKLNKTSMTLDYSRSYTLKATVAPSCAANKKLTWKSSNTKVATVSSKGVVKAVGKGTATITCTSQDGSKKTAKCTVKVVKTDVIGVKLDVSNKIIARNGSFRLTATVLPEKASNKAVKWTTSNPAVATVSSNGTVTAKGAGSCVIKVITVDGKCIASCRVRVL